MKFDSLGSSWLVLSHLLYTHELNEKFRVKECTVLILFNTPGALQCTKEGVI